jgi:hypothetical protein
MAVQGQDCTWYEILLLDVLAVYAAALVTCAVLLRLAHKLLKKPAGPTAYDIRVRSRVQEARGPGTPSPPQSPVHSSAGYKAHKED